MAHLLNRARQSVDIILATICVTLLAALVVAVSWQVASRLLLTRPSTVTDELARFLLIWLVLFGAAYCVGKKSHLSIDLLSSHLNGPMRRLLSGYTDIMVFAFALGVMTRGGLRLIETVIMSQAIAPALQIPMTYVYIALPASGVLICFYSALSFIDSTLLGRICDPHDQFEAGEK